MLSIDAFIIMDEEFSETENLFKRVGKLDKLVKSRSQTALKKVQDQGLRDFRRIERTYAKSTRGVNPFKTGTSVSPMYGSVISDSVNNEKFVFRLHNDRYSHKSFLLMKECITRSDLYVKP